MVFKKNCSLNIKINLIFPLIILNFTGASSLETNNNRLKRAVVYPQGGAFKLVLGVAVPVKLGTKQSMAIGWNIQFQYVTPTNASQLHSWPPIISRSREKREVEERGHSDRALFYMAIEGLLNREGINGRECVLRSICENAVDSTYHDANGLYGQLLHIMLTPDYGDDGGAAPADLDPVYLEAQRAGQFGVECGSLFADCENGGGFLLDLFSVVDNALY